MYIKSTRRLPEEPRPRIVSPTEATPGKPGLLVGVERPSPELAEAARTTLGLASPPESLLIGVPASAVELTPLEKALLGTGLSAVKMMSKELAKSSGSKLVEGGVNALWLGVKVWKLYDRWQAPDGNVVALFVDTTAAALSALDLAYDATDKPSPFFDDDVLQEKLDLLFTSTKAAATGESVAMALTNKRFGATEVGKVLNLFSPILQAAADGDPAFAGVRFKPLPYVSSASAHR